MKLHCIGDSHVSIFNGVPNVISEVGCYPFRDDSLKDIYTYNIGPAVAYNVAIDGHSKNITTKEIVQEFVQLEDAVLFSYGQIDSAIHIPRQHRIQNRTIEDLSIECANQYFQFIQSLEHFSKLTIIYGPVAPGNMLVTDYPFKEKLKAVEVMTRQLIELSKNSNIEIIPLFDLLVTEDGLGVHKHLFYDKTHLSSTFFPIIEDELNMRLTDVSNF